MRIYFAGLKEISSITLMVNKGVHKLLSYAYPDAFKHYTKAIRDIKPEKKGTLIIDSGAFTLWNKGRYVNLDRYIDFCKKCINDYHDCFTEIHCVNLDVIPGGQGRKPTPVELSESAQKGWDNYLYMKSKGVDSMHIFHAGEDFKWLDLLLKECHYIGISPSNDYSGDMKMAWLQECFQVVCNLDGTPKIKTHGFGVTSEDLLKIFPWFSVDSASWSISSGYGVMKTPYGTHIMSLKRPEHPGLYLKLPRIEQEYIKKWVSERGVDIKDCIRGYRARDIVNIHYFLWLQDELNKNEIRYTQKQLSWF